MRLVDRLADVDRDRWRELTHGAPLFMQAEFLEALEDAPPSNARPLYGIIEREGRRIAALAGQRIKVEMDRAARPGELGDAVGAALKRVELEAALWGNYLTPSPCTRGSARSDPSARS